MSNIPLQAELADVLDLHPEVNQTKMTNWDLAGVLVTTLESY